MSSSKPLRNVHLDDSTVFLAQLSGERLSFVPDGDRPTSAPGTARRLPRNRAELDNLMEQRLAIFDERRRSQCEQAFERGVQEGLKRQSDAAERRLEDAKKPLSNLALAVQSELALAREHLYKHSAELAAALTSSLVGRLVQLNPAAFLAALRDTLEPLRHMDEIRVRLNPVDYETLKDGLGGGEEIFRGLEGLEVLADADIAPGGAFAESKGGSVDARLKTRMEAAVKLLGAESHVA